MDVDGNAEPATPESDALSADPYGAMRAAIERLDRDVPGVPVTTSRRPAKKACQKARRQLRVSNITVGLLRNIGALAAPAPVVALALQPASYSAALMSRGSAVG
jgi:hypothetical protein